MKLALAGNTPIGTTSMFFVVFFFFQYASIAQALKPPVKIGKVRGQIIDNQTNTPVEYATVALVNSIDTSNILGALADEKGNFVVDQVAEGEYQLKVSFIGYSNYKTDNIRISKSQPVVNIGQIKLKNTSKLLGDINVTGEREQMQLSIDKKIYEVDKNPVVAGGSASDVLKQIPSVSVDTDGNINVRGTGNITIWVNGKPFANAGSPQQILDQMPASSIERVELITNPSARYDADGMGGIINIILKKNRADGMNGQVSSGCGTRDAYNESRNNNYDGNKFDNNTINKYNGNASLNWKVGKWNFTSNYGYRYGQRWQSHRSERANFGSNTNYQNQRSAAELYSHNHLLNLGAEYSINDKNTIDVRVTGGYTQNVEPERLTYKFQDATKTDTQNRVRNVNKYEYAYNIDANVGYRKTFNTPAKELNVSGSASWANNYGNTNFNQISNFPLTPTLNPSTPSLSGTKPNNLNRILIGQIDFIQPFGEKTRFELGAKITYRNFENDFYFDSVSTISNQTVKDNSKSNIFRYTDDVNAVYGIWNQLFPKGFSIQAGLRAEQTIRTIEQVTLGTTANPTPIIDLFPTLHILKKLANEQELKASYSRRINRPSPNTLNPFPSYNDPLNLVIGNPYLKPEYINSFELAYSKNWKKHTFLATAYLRQIEGSTQRVRSVDVLTGVSTVEYANIGYARNSGLELIVKNELWKWWNITSNVNGFFSEINSGNSGNANNINYSNISGNARFTSNFKIWQGADLQVAGYYMFPVAIAQGTFYGMSAVDIGFKKDIIPQKAFITVNITDVFNTRQFNSVQSSSNFEANNFRKRETRVLTVNFTYKFGNESLAKGKASKRNTNQNNNDSGGGGGDF
ncbi:MAG: TonB-dependent receptor domain-containing protein [Cytophagales bacterium]